MNWGRQKYGCWCPAAGPHRGCREGGGGASRGLRLIRVLLRAKPHPLSRPDRAAEGIPDSCTDYPIRHCLGFQLVANGTGR